MHSNTRRQQGQAVVEMALVLPILLLLLLGVISFGLLYSHQLIITTAAREGARRGAVGETDEEIAEVIRLRTATLNQEHLSWEITPPDDAPNRVPGENLTVEVFYDDYIPIPIISWFANPKRLYAKAVMKIEVYPSVFAE
ncbi:MAG TPA: pilus assembly protein [Armatimonadetes bacterium]|nr:pilus assembly protein [Armatimonadota bacterium]